MASRPDLAIAPQITLAGESIRSLQVRLSFEDDCRHGQHQDHQQHRNPAAHLRLPVGACLKENITVAMTGRDAIVLMSPQVAMRFDDHV